MDDCDLTLSEAAGMVGVDEEFFPTHMVSFYGLKCMYNDRHKTLWAFRGWLDFMIPVLSFVHNLVADMTHLAWPWFQPKGFPLKVLAEYRYVKRGGFIDIEDRRKVETGDKDQD